MKIRRMTNKMRTERITWGTMVERFLKEKFKVPNVSTYSIARIRIKAIPTPSVSLIILFFTYKDLKKFVIKK
jgi:hypothetical protein